MEAPKKKLPVTQIRNTIAIGTLYKIQLTNLFLRIVTLGIYSFWAKVRLRQYITSSFRIDSDRFEYTGTVKEAFKGFMFATLVLIGLVIVYSALAAMSGESILLQAGYMLTIFGLITAARFFALRYKLSRVRLKGIAFSYNDTFGNYARHTLLPRFVAALTLGLAAPWAHLSSWNGIANRCRYGKTAFQARKVNRSALTRVHIVTWLLMIPTLGFSRLWYHAELRRLKMASLSVGELRFKSMATGKDYLFLVLGNLVLLIFTLGIGLPVIIARNARFAARYVLIGGDYQAFSTRQDTLSHKDATGDDLAGDIDFAAAI